MAEFNNRKDAEDYIEKKYVAPWKATLAKIEAMEADVAHVRQKFAVNPPQGLDPGAVEQFNQLKGQCAKTFGYFDRYFSTIRQETELITKRLDRFKREQA